MCVCVRERERERENEREHRKGKQNEGTWKEKVNCESMCVVKNPKENIDEKLHKQQH